MQLNNQKKTTTASAEKPKKEKKTTANATAKPKKTALERAFITASAAMRSAEKLGRTTGAWELPDDAALPFGRTAGQIRETLATLRKAIEHLTGSAEIIKNGITTLAQANFKPKDGNQTSKLKLEPGVRVHIKQKQLEVRYDFLTELQREALFVEREDTRGFLVVCKAASGYPFVVGYMAKSALVAQPPTATNGAAPPELFIEVA